jgi:hypothetical protein
MFIVDDQELTESQRLGWLADDEHDQKPLIRATFDLEYPFCVATPSGEPIKSYRTYKQAWLAIEFLEDAA